MASHLLVLWRAPWPSNPSQRALRDISMPRAKNQLPTVSRQFLTRDYPRRAHPNCLFQSLPNCLSPTRVRNEISAQRGSFGPDIPADIRPETSVRAPKSWKNKHFRAARGRPSKNFGPKNFGLIFRSLKRGNFGLIQNLKLPHGEGNCAATERHKSSRGNFASVDVSPSPCFLGRTLTVQKRDV